MGYSLWGHEVVDTDRLTQGTLSAQEQSPKTKCLGDKKLRHGHGA